MDMRVFDHYYYNIADKVKRKDTVSYLEKMLADIGTGYKEISFDISIVMRKTPGDLIKDFPVLEDYYFYYDPFRFDILTSLTPDWEKGQIYASPEAREAVLEIFSKIPRGYNISGRLMLHQIDWFGEGVNEPVIKSNFDNGRASICGNYCVTDNAIFIERGFDGEKINKVELIIEATTDGVPRDTRELINKLEEYLGQPEDTYRECCFTREQTELNMKYRDEVSDLLCEAIAEKYSGDRSDMAERLRDVFVPALVDKKMIKKAFAGTDFEMPKTRKGILPGMNVLSCKDEHNFRYEVAIDRTQNCPTFFYFYITITGCNFVVKNTQDVIVAASREEAEQKLATLASFASDIKDKFGPVLAERFGDTPAWFYNGEE